MRVFAALLVLVLLVTLGVLLRTDEPREPAAAVREVRPPRAELEASRGLPAEDPVRENHTAPPTEEDRREIAATTKRISGHVALPTGTPLDDWVALDVVCSLGHPNGVKLDERRVTVDAGGAFELTVPVRTDHLTFELTGRYVFLDDPVTLPADRPIVLHPRLGGRIVGVVTADGEPVPGVSISLGSLGDVEVTAGPSRLPTEVGVSFSVREGVRLTPPMLTGLGEPLVTRADGSFEFGGVLGGHVVAMTHPEHVPWQEVVDVSPGETVQVAPRLFPECCIEGRLVSPDEDAGELEFDVRLTIDASVDGVLVMERYLTLTAGPFLLCGLPPGTIRLDVAGPGRGAVEVQLAPAEHLEGVLLALDAAVLIEGSIVWEDGAPFPDLARIVCRAPGDADRTESVLEGRFRFDGLEARTPYELSIDVPGGIDTTPGRAVVASVTAPRRGLEIRLQRGTIVHGVVRDAHGELVQGAHVFEIAGLAPATSTDKYGRFSVSVFDEPALVLRASTPGLGPGPDVAVDLPTSGVVSGIELRLGGGRCDLVGEIIMPAGDHPFPSGVAVRAGVGEGGRLVHVGTAPVDALGLFELRDCAPGRVSLSAFVQDPRTRQRFLGETEAELASGENRVTLRLERMTGD